MTAPEKVAVRRRVPAQLRQLFNQQEAIVLAVLVALFLTFTMVRPANFATAGNLQNLARDGAILLILAVAITYVTVLGMFDLSIGSVLVFSEVCAVKVTGALQGSGGPAIIAGLVVAIVAGAAWGTINGFLVARLKLSPFIVTLATLGAALGAAQLISGGNDLTTIPESLATFVGVDSIAGIPVLVVIALLVAVIGGIQLAQSRFGLLTYAIGSNSDAARRTGIHVNRHIIAVYIIAGALAGLAGFLDSARFGTTTIGGHGNDALAAITAVALGGASLYGGRGSMLGTVIGVSIPVVLQNGLVIIGVQSFWYQIVVAAALIASIYLDSRRRAGQQRA